LNKQSGVYGIVKDIIIVVIGVAIIWASLMIIFGTTNPFYVVSSGSMEPVLDVFDVLVVQGNEPFDKIQKGDIIVFNRPNGHDRVIVHRVAEIIDEDPRVIRTKGDANPASIPGTDMPITKDEYIGKVAYVIPQIGYITRILSPPTNYIIIAVIIGVMIYKQYGRKKAKSDQTIPLDQLPPTDPSSNISTHAEAENFGDRPKNTGNDESKEFPPKES
jgi:signal peptidase I